ncbi:DoxX family protein [Corynebacterium bovis]
MTRSRAPTARPDDPHRHEQTRHEQEHRTMIRKLARPLLASAFAVDGVQMLLDSKQYTDGAAKTTKVLHGVLPSAVAGFLPRDPEQAVRVTATTKVTAATVLGLGKAPRLAATVLTLIQIPTAVTRHAFWATDDAREKDSRKKGLVTDLALLGGLAITSADTAGAPGLRWRAEKAGQQVSKKVQDALPGQSEQEQFRQNVQEQAQDVLGRARDLGEQAAETVQSRASDLAGTVSDYVDDHSDEWRETAEKVGRTARKQAAQARKKAEKQAKKQAKKARKAGLLPS